MKKQFYYIYVGDNGIIETPIYLPGVPSVKKCCLIADEGKLLTKDDITFKRSISVPVSSIDEWYEVIDVGQM